METQDSCNSKISKNMKQVPGMIEKEIEELRKFIVPRIQALESEMIIDKLCGPPDTKGY